MFQFDSKPLKWVGFLFGVEVVIARFVRDAVIRPYGGDVLAVMLVYAALRSVLRLEASVLAAVAFGVGVLVEIAQLLQLSTWLGFSGSKLATTVLGAVFEWEDLVAYALGAALAWIIDEKTAIVSGRERRDAGIGRGPARGSHRSGVPPTLSARIVEDGARIPPASETYDDAEHNDRPSPRGSSRS